MSDKAQAAIDWTVFLRAMAEGIDSLGGPVARDVWLRSVGERMGAMRPISPVPNMESLTMEMNDVLAAMGWGQVGFQLNEQDRSLLITHTHLPRVGAAGDPPGTWLSALLEGLYRAWMGQLPGADPSLVAQRLRVTPQTVLLRYGKPAG